MNEATYNGLYKIWTPKGYVVLDLYMVSSIGIMLSGGLDSAVLLFALCRALAYHKQRVPITAYTVPRVSSHLHAGRVRKAVIGSTGYPFVTHNTDVDNRGSDPGAVFEGIKRVVLGAPESHIFTAVNQNPPVHINGIPPVRIQENPMPGRLRMPFLHLQKDSILEAAKSIGATHIFPVTHSCTEQEFGRCGECWQCGERAWAFRMANMTDLPEMPYVD